MKKTIIGLVAALFIGQGAMAQSTPEITYVEDPSQGYLFNRFQDNWFISAEGGINYYFDANNKARKLMDRFSPNAGIWVGKWFSPIVALRAGANFTQIKGLSFNGGAGYYGTFKDGNTLYNKYARNEFSANLDAMVNLTNWWCGYRPGRVYNAILYAGVGYDFQYVPKWTRGTRDGWEKGHDKNLTGHVGLINNFNLTKNFAIYLDVRAGLYGESFEVKYPGKEHIDLQAYLGVTYTFNKATWNAPVVAVIPEIPDCSAIEAQLQAANAQIASLQAQLRDCLNRPVQVVEKGVEGPLCTIYYTIGSSKLNRVDTKVLGAVAEVMKSNPNQTYVVTGWADNYTGTEQINVRLRKARAAGVEKVLLRNGVNPSQLDVTTNNGNLNDMGAKMVSLDRAVTITKK
ncbi:MAG: OmpA family protein [Duncaniella sp.]|nr:OmpA family protein [Duncaniella sp.]